MKPVSKRWPLIGLAVVAIIVAGWLVFGHSHEPQYKGHTVSYWFKEYCQACEARSFDIDRVNDSQEALVKLGTNAVPYLLEQAFDTNQDSAARTNLIRFINSLPRSWPIAAPVSQETMQGTASVFLYRIHPPADQVLPFLEQQFRITNSPNNFARRQAILLMGYIGDGVERAVPLLVEALNDPDLQSQRLALSSLGEMGPKAGAAVPALQQKLASETSTSRRLWIASILFRIEKRPEDLKILTDSLSVNRPLGEREDAAELIRQIGPDARAAAPALIAALPAKDVVLNQDIISTLRLIGVPSGDFVGRLKGPLKSDNAQERLQAARTVTLAVPTDPDALKILEEAANAKGPQKQGVTTGSGTNASGR